MSNKKIIFLSFILIITVSLGLFLTSSKKETLTDNHSHEIEQEVYTCPMHPEIRQDKPGSCPICHMKLVKVENKKGTERKAEGSLDISPYQADLIGINPIDVLKKEVTHTIPTSGRILSRSTIALQVFERDLRYLKRGVKFSGRTEIYPESRIVGKVTSVDNFADPSSRTIRVVGQITSGIQSALSEASFTGQIQVDLGSKLVIPERAVLFTGHGSFVYIYEDKTLHPQEVVLGPKFGEEYVVLKGLSENDKISSGPNFLIDSESKIRGLNDQKHH